MQTQSILTTALCLIFLGGPLCAVAQQNTDAQSPATAQSPTTNQGPATTQDSTTGESPTATQSSTATENTPTPDDILNAQIAKARAEEYDRFERSKQMEDQLEYARQLRALGQYGAPAQNGYAQGQQPIQDSRTRTYSASNYDPARQNYDPAAGPNAKKQSWSGALDAATGHVNPCNHDWGGLLAQWHIAVAQETIENAYFYVCCVESMVLVLLALWVSELREQRRVRLIIAGDVVAQLYNQYVNARNKAYQTIHAYNRLVEQTEDRLDALMSNEGTSEITPPGPRTPNPSLDISGNIIKPANTGTQFIRRTKESAPAGNDGTTDLNDKNGANDSLPEQEPISLESTDAGTVSESADVAAVHTDSHSGIQSPDESETMRRQIETLQARLQNKNLRINELEDALAVSSNRNKIPEL
ncbi:MAG: hypothetical protein ACYCPO_06085 [Acidobacteriaceae bacterium]